MVPLETSTLHTFIVLATAVALASPLPFKQTGWSGGSNIVFPGLTSSRHLTGEEMTNTFHDMSGDLAPRMLVPERESIPSYMYGPDFAWDTMGMPRYIGNNPTSHYTYRKPSGPSIDSPVVLKNNFGVLNTRLGNPSAQKSYNAPYNNYVASNASPASKAPSKYGRIAVINGYPNYSITEFNIKKQKFSTKPVVYNTQNRNNNFGNLTPPHYFRYPNY